MPGELIYVEIWRAIIFLSTHICLSVIVKAGMENLGDLTRNSAIGGKKIEFVFRHSDLQIDIGNRICTAEAEKVVTFLPKLPDVK